MVLNLRGGGPKFKPVANSVFDATEKTEWLQGASSAGLSRSPLNALLVVAKVLGVKIPAHKVRTTKGLTDQKPKKELVAEYIFNYCREKLGSDPDSGINSDPEPLPGFDISGSFLLL